MRSRSRRPCQVLINKRCSTICEFILILPKGTGMKTSAYWIISEVTEDRFDKTDNLADAIRIARTLVRESQAGDPIAIEHQGRVIRQLVLLPDGRVSGQEIR